MATPQHRHALTRTLLALGLAVASAVAVLPAGTSSAEPRPTTEQVEARLEALNTAADIAVEAFEESRLQLAAAQRKAAVVTARVAREQRALDELKRSMAGVLAAAYRSGGTDEMMSLVGSGDPQAFLDRAAALDRIASNQASKLAVLKTQRSRLAAAQATAVAEAAALTKAQAKLAADKAAVERSMSASQAVLSGLRADERARLDAARAASAAADRRAAAAARDAAPRASRSKARELYTGPASGRAAVAVREAYNKLGSPYKWGAAGPDRFDCSGLTMWVWGKAGVSLPHSSRAQFASGRKVARSDIQPGDLLYFGSPIHHVAIYVGGGKMIAAPQTGDVVKIRSIQRKDYAGATRP